MQSIISTVQSGINVVQTAVNNVIDTTAQAANNVLNAVSNAAVNVANGIASGAQAFVNSMETAIAINQNATVQAIETFVNGFQAAAQNQAQTQNQQQVSAGNTFTVTTSSGNQVTLYKIDNQNPLSNSQLVQQNDFASGPNANTTIANAGCNFLAIAAVG